MLKRTSSLRRGGPLKRTGRIRRVSRKRARLAKAYSLLREAFLLAHPMCQAWAKISTAHPDSEMPYVCPPSCEIHHVNGRSGTNYLNTDTWLAVCWVAHRWIHQNGGKARALGLLT